MDEKRKDIWPCETCGADVLVPGKDDPCPVFCSEECNNWDAEFGLQLMTVITNPGGSIEVVRHNPPPSPKGKCN